MQETGRCRFGGHRSAPDSAIRGATEKEGDAAGGGALHGRSRAAAVRRGRSLLAGFIRQRLFVWPAGIARPYRRETEPLQATGQATQRVRPEECADCTLLVDRTWPSDHAARTGQGERFG